MPSFGISKSAQNIINVTWRFSLFSSASVKLNWATTSLLLLPSPHPSPCSLQDVVFLGARCYKHSSENKTALWFHPHLLQASLTAPGNCSGTTNCCRALHGFTNRETVAATHLSLKRLQNMMHIIYQFVFIYYIYTWLPVQLGLKSLGMYFMCSNSGRLNSVKSSSSVLHITVNHRAAAFLPSDSNSFIFVYQLWKLLSDSLPLNQQGFCN